MSLNIILGKPKTGKSRYIYEQIEKDIESKREVILFVPSQQRLETEYKYMETLKKPGIIGVNITTISEYIKDNITRLGIYTDDRYISKQDKKMILADVISKLDLSVFKSVSKKEGFLELIYIYIDLLRKSEFDFKTLDKLEINNKLVYEKLKEICKIYEVYLNEIKEKFVDSIDEISMFLSNISKLNFSNTCIYIDSYNNFTESEFKVINSLISLSKSVLLGSLLKNFELITTHKLSSVVKDFE
jgi:ATP-dependent helicase/nuclease subunit B